MKYIVERAVSGDQITQAASIENRCIMFGKGNHDRAKQTWEIYKDAEDCVYFLVKDKGYPNKLIGYVRLLCVGHSGTKTWIADYVSPSKYESVVLASQEVIGTVLVKEFVADDDLLAKSWPTLSTTFHKLERYPYHQVQMVESGWRVIS